MAEMKAYGTYNANGPRSELSMGGMVAGIRAALPGSLDIKFTWVPADADFLEQHQVRGWSGMPVWRPLRPDNPGRGRISIARALAKGLTYRSLADTTQATLAWYHPWIKAQPAERQARMLAGIPAAKEAEVLAAWKARAASGS
jgi:2'-hydroxyisoflavone reductase